MIYPILYFVFLLCLPLFAQAESEDLLNTRGDYTKEELMSQLTTNQGKLDLEQAKTEMERAKSEYEEVKGLFDSKVETIIQLTKSKQAFEQATLRYQQARIELQKTRLDLLKNATLITVVDAKKYRTDDGRVMVSVTLRNNSDVNQARIAMAEVGKTGEKELTSLLTIDNMVVSLEGTAQVTDGERTTSSKAIIGDPFQQIISKLKVNEERTLHFALIKPDIEDITLDLNFLNQHKEYNVFLKKEASQDIPTINSTQYAQQGQLGSKILYDLKMERLAKSEQSFSLVVLNLPKEFPFEFTDPSSRASITNLKFSEQISKQKLNFELSVPEKLDPSFIDRNIDFSIIVTRQEELIEISKLKAKYQGQNIPLEEIAKIKGSKVQLILIPKGKGSLELVIPNLYREIRKNETVDIKITVLNAGTMTMINVTAKADFPVEWDGTIEPKEITNLEAGQKSVVTIHVVPPSDVPVGEYAIKITTKGYAGVETIEAAEKNFTVRIVAKSNIAGTVFLVLILIGMVVGIAVASIKISRR
jgi:uncharacterized membrane protein